ncbi:MAG TPA: CTP synthase [Phycisphaerae bacterium]|nr:CTP synthase [Phycisphaerae bacterium]HDZ42683.1 CTP synthase [Phycisphaerae bacterium]
MSDAMDLLRSVKDRTDETEFYTPLPDGYQLGKVKYVAIFGTVISGLGKGIFSSSLAKILKDKGLRVSPIKLEGYLNIDSGTLNPFRHGEVFVLDDGLETDMDLGTYERMLDQDLGRANFATSGQIFSTVLNKERAGSFLGRDVQMIPHVTGEVKMRLRELAMQTRADVVFIEVGGTVGDIENSFFIEAIRELRYEEGEQSVVCVALTYVLAPPALGEQKSKAAQLGMKRLMAYGILPDIIACRAEEPVLDKVRQKLSLYSNVPIRRVFSMHDLPSIYLLPNALREAGIDSEVVQLLGLGGRVNSALEAKAVSLWNTFADRLLKSDNRRIRIGVTGKYTSLRDSYASIIKALEHAGVANDVAVDIDWIDTTDITDETAAEALADVDGIIVPGGFGVRGTAGKIACIGYARRNKLPYLGICLGFQMAVVEYARNVCGLADADSTELSPDCETPVIDILPEQKKIEGLGGNMRLGGQDVEITPGTLIAELFEGAEQIRQRFRHRYEVDPTYIETLESGGLVFSGRHPVHPIMQVLELPRDVHPYFLAAQFHPELTSRPLRPQPMFVGLVAAALQRKNAAVTC